MVIWNYVIICKTWYHMIVLHETIVVYKGLLLNRNSYLKPCYYLTWALNNITKFDMLEK